MQKIASLLVVFALCGCVHQRTARQEARSAVQRELEGFATLFQKIVAVENREPADHESLGSFFAMVPKKTLGDLGATVPVDASGQPILSDGSMITFSRSFGSCMLFEKGSVTSMDYTFMATGHDEKAVISISATFGDPFEESGKPNQSLEPAPGSRSAAAHL
jgi:hypothetical protein